jgi:hypothetical protein
MRSYNVLIVTPDSSYVTTQLWDVSPGELRSWILERADRDELKPTTPVFWTDQDTKTQVSTNVGAVRSGDMRPKRR